MIIHIDSQTGSPVFVLNQMMMLDALRIVYHKYGIHGIHYAVLFGWQGSPFAMITDDDARDGYVVREVYNSTYYDPIDKQSKKMENFSTKDQYKQEDMKNAIKIINELAPVPVIQNKLFYLKLLDKNKVALDQDDINPANKKGIADQAKNQELLLKNRNLLDKTLNEMLEREKELLMKSDPKTSLDDFITKINAK